MFYLERHRDFLHLNVTRVVFIWFNVKKKKEVKKITNASHQLHREKKKKEKQNKFYDSSFISSSSIRDSGRGSVSSSSVDDIGATGPGAISGSESTAGAGAADVSFSS